MTSRTSAPASGRAATWIGIAIGVITLGLLALFAIALPKAVGDEHQAVRLVLPDTLPGGYAAADDPAAFEGGDYADQADSIAEQERSNSDYGNRILPEVLGHAAVTRTYVLDGSKAVFVQVFDAEGGAFAPNSIPDPEASGGAPANEVTNVGDGVCILSYGQGSTDAGPPDPVFSQCQVSRDGRTVQIGASDVDADHLVATADDLLDGLRDS
ncbi:hypothetical protein [Nocardioides sp.]|uniref:hypothetical protein n=1 Tax=Nocardioides sp. TaxID=35761 RepID=UPI002606F91D|nr:hypothetical protein [Nocardioides sp.]MDI6909419.1 hypothetical protein [Nocardioides sp.]